MRTGAEDFADLGQQRCEEQHQRGIATLRRRAAALGSEIDPSSAAA